MIPSRILKGSLYGIDKGASYKGSLQGSLKGSLKRISGVLRLQTKISTEISS